MGKDTRTRKCANTFNSRILLFFAALIFVLGALFLLISSRIDLVSNLNRIEPDVMIMGAIMILVLTAIVTKSLYFPNYLKRHLSGAPFGAEWNTLRTAINNFFNLMNLTIIFAGISLLSSGIPYIGWIPLYASWLTAIMVLGCCLHVIIRLIRLKSGLTVKAKPLFFSSSVK